MLLERHPKCHTQIYLFLFELISMQLILLELAIQLHANGRAHARREPDREAIASFASLVQLHASGNHRMRSNSKQQMSCELIHGGIELANSRSVDGDRKRQDGPRAGWRELSRMHMHARRIRRLVKKRDHRAPTNGVCLSHG